MSIAAWSIARDAATAFAARDALVPIDDAARAAFAELRSQRCEDLLERAFLRAFERALRDDALPRWREACAMPSSIDAGALERTNAEERDEEEEETRARRGVDASGGGAGDDGVRGVDRKRARTRASVQRGRAGGE